MNPAIEMAVLELAKTLIERALSWPVIFVVVIFIFRSRIDKVGILLRDIVNSLTLRGFTVGLGKEGVTLAAEAITAQEQSKKIDGATGLAETPPAAQDPPRAGDHAEVPISSPDVSNSRLQQLRSVGNSPIAIEQVTSIRKDLESLSISQEEKVDLLIRHLAVNQLAIRAEVTYRNIFGSQISLLKFLNASAATTKKELMRFYEKAAKESPVLYSRYSYDQYFNFLVSQGLITQQPPDRYAISIAGREFLKWIVGEGLNENKPF